MGSLGVLLSLLAGVSRTVFSMSRNHDFPSRLASVHPRFRTPHRAELGAAILVIILVLFVDVRGAIGFSSFAVLVYYGIANVSAWTQPSGQRRWPRALQAVGVVGCSVLALTLPPLIDPRRVDHARLRSSGLGGSPSVGIASVKRFPVCRRHPSAGRNSSIRVRDLAWSPGRMPHLRA